MADDRPSTPPRATRPPHPPTPEQVRRTEEARLKAKAHRSRDEAAPRVRIGGQTRSTASGQKRAHSTLSTVSPNHRDGRANNASTAAAAAAGLAAPPVDAAIRPAKKFARAGYIDYDFSAMTDTKGGFLTAADDGRAPRDADAPGAEGQRKPAHMTTAEWERVQVLRKLRAQRQGPFRPGVSALDADAPDKKCRECGTLDVDFQWLEVFGCAVCSACKAEHPETYSLLTKTEARQDYLLTDPELMDRELFAWLEKPNPHRRTTNMQLYLRYQVEMYAFSEKRWGSGEALDAEFERRETAKAQRKEKKFKSRLEELKKRTMVEAYKRGKDMREKGSGRAVKAAEEKHVHEWGMPLEDQETGLSVRSCVECGMEVQELEM